MPSFSVVKRHFGPSYKVDPELKAALDSTLGTDQMVAIPLERQHLDEWQRTTRRPWSDNEQIKFRYRYNKNEKTVYAWLEYVEPSTQQFEEAE